MRIETEVKLDFKDVLIRPKRSTLSTRSNVDVSREFRFRHAQVDYHGVPIIAANMDTTGTIEMARALDPFQLSTALHKHYSVDELVAFFTGLERKVRGVLFDGDHDGRRREVRSGADGSRLRRRRARSATSASTSPMATPKVSCASSQGYANGIRIWSSWPATS